MEEIKQNIVNSKTHGITGEIEDCEKVVCFKSNFIELSSLKPIKTLTNPNGIKKYTQILYHNFKNDIVDLKKFKEFIFKNFIDVTFEKLNILIKHYAHENNIKLSVRLFKIDYKELPCVELIIINKNIKIEYSRNNLSLTCLQDTENSYYLSGKMRNKREQIKKITKKWNYDNDTNLDSLLSQIDKISKSKAILKSKIEVA